MHEIFHVIWLQVYTVFALPISQHCRFGVGFKMFFEEENGLPTLHLGKGLFVLVWRPTF